MKPSGVSTSSGKVKIAFRYSILLFSYALRVQYRGTSLALINTRMFPSSLTSNQKYRVPLKFV